MIKLIAFDLMGVIFTEPHIISNLLYSLLPEPKDYAFIKEKYSLYTKGKISNQEFWKSVYKGYNYEDFEKTYLDKIKIDKDYKEIINYLKQKYELGIISNLPKEWGEYLIKKYELDKVFNPIVISGEVKVKKPNTEIYKIFQNEVKTQFNEIAYIDDRKSNLKPAHILGMKTIWYKKEEDNLNFMPDYTINRLKELINLF